MPRSYHFTANRRRARMLGVACRSPAHAVHHAAAAVVIGFLVRENYGVAAPSPNAVTVPRASSYSRARSAKYPPLTT